MISNVILPQLQWRIILGQVADTPTAPMKSLPDATNAVTLN